MANSAKGFFRVYRRVFESAAYRSLSLYARCTYDEILTLYKGRNNGNLAMSERSLAIRLKTEKKQASRALEELIEASFIEITTPGGPRKPARYRVVCWKCDVFGMWAGEPSSPRRKATAKVKKIRGPSGPIAGSHRPHIPLQIVK